MKGSIIIPCYNVENYITGMLDSLYKDKDILSWQLILINDGSTDRTYECLTSYNKANIIIINQSNKGQSESRNIGIRYAVGEYVIFLDADDEVSEGFISELYETAIKNESDVVVSNIFSKYNDGTIDIYNSRNYLVDDYGILNGRNEHIVSEFLRDRLSVSPCNKLIKKSILDEAPFLNGYINEDMLFAFKLYSSDIVFERNSNATYYYMFREYSTTKRSDVRIMDMYYVLDEIKKSDGDKFIISSDWTYFYVKFGLILTLNRARNSDWDVKKKVVNKIINDISVNSFKELYASCETTKQKIIVTLLKVLSKMKFLICRSS